MKTITTFLTMIVVATVFSTVAFAGTDPTSVNITFFNAYLSENGDCTSPVQIAGGGPDGSKFDMASSPTLGRGEVKATIYKCLIIEMADQVEITVGTSPGVGCAEGTKFTLDVCRAGSTSENPFTGAVTNCTNVGGDRVFLYLSQYSANPNPEESFRRPTGEKSTRGVNLANAIDVSNGGGTFIFDTRGTVISTGSVCEMNIPRFGFRPQ